MYVTALATINVPSISRLRSELELTQIPCHDENKIRIWSFRRARDLPEETTEGASEASVQDEQG